MRYTSGVRVRTDLEKGEALRKQLFCGRIVEKAKERTIRPNVGGNACPDLRTTTKGSVL